MTKHPITPPPELVHQMTDHFVDTTKMVSLNQLPELVAKWASSMFGYYEAAQWGADQELEACCEWIPELTPWDAEQLRIARRPKPPSLKEQALEALQFVDEKLDLPLHNHCNAIHTIRRALEALDD